MSGPDPTEDLLDLYENAPCGYLSLAPDSTIVRANRTLLGWLDLSADDLVGKPLRDLLGTGGRIAYETHLAPLLRLQGFVYEIALDLRCDHGLVPVIANASEKRDESDNHLFTRLTLFLAEDRRKYERNLLESKIRAESETEQRDREAELREQFIAVLGHDLRNPVAALKAGTDLLKDSGNLDTEDREIVTQMDSTIDRAIELINNVMDFARGRLGSGISLELQPAPDLDRKLERMVLRPCWVAWMPTSRTAKNVHAQSGQNGCQPWTELCAEQAAHEQLGGILLVQVIEQVIEHTRRHGIYGSATVRASKRHG